MDGVTLPVTFVGEEDEIYEIEWTLEEPFSDLDKLQPETKVMAPWVRDGKVYYDEASLFLSQNPH